MRHIKCDVAVIGAGPAGLAAAAGAKEAGAGRVVIAERDTNPGGILQQCIHPGFGLTYFREELTGPEYAARFEEEARSAGAEFLFGTTALELRGRTVICVSPEGMIELESRAVVLAMGCRERTRANLVIPGARPAGIYTAGSAQRLLNVQGRMPGRNIVILGSGDIGMIMARRLTIEGAKVTAVIEIMPYLAGLIRNKVQCLDDFGIPLFLSHTVTDITGRDRVESVTVAQVGDDKKPIAGTERVIECDTLLLSVGLIPENELTSTGGIELDTVTRGPRVDQFMQTESSGIFSCGNVLHVNDLVDNVSGESRIAGANAALFSQGKLPSGECIATAPGTNVRYVCPQRISKSGTEDVKLFFRAVSPRENVDIIASCNGRELYRGKRFRAAPGEMDHAVIPASELGGLSGSVIVSVEG